VSRIRISFQNAIPPHAFRSLRVLSVRRACAGNVVLAGARCQCSGVVAETTTSGCPAAFTLLEALIFALARCLLASPRPDAPPPAPLVPT
jgi:hypothetical protein